MEQLLKNAPLGGYEYFFISINALDNNLLYTLLEL